MIAFEWAIRPDECRVADAIDALETLRSRAHGFPGPGALHETYGEVVRLAALALTTLANLPPPDEVDGLRDYEGFELWRASRRTED